MTFDVHAVSAGAFEDWHTKHANSGQSLTESHLRELTKPSVMSAPMYMSLPDKDIYNTIIMKYMMQGSTSEDDSATMDNMSGMDHGSGH